jgi:hypothetical protein
MAGVDSQMHQPLISSRSLDAFCDWTVMLSAMQIIDFQLKFGRSKGRKLCKRAKVVHSLNSLKIYAPSNGK